MAETKRCLICGSYNWIEKHHVFGGPNRKNSEKYGMVIDLCHYCHNEPPYGVHFNHKNDLQLKQKYQRLFAERYPNENFMGIFGRNYL